MKLHNLCLIALFSLLNSLSGASLSLKSFDVGQGNCSLVRCSEPGAPILLIDAGSSTYKSVEKAETIIDDIVMTILDHAKKYKQYTLGIIISHPDSDHYNWVEEIVGRCDALLGLAFLYLGGKKSSYSEKFRAFIDKKKGSILEEKKEAIFPANKGDSDEISKNLTTNYRLIILPALKEYGASKDSKNRASLVVKCCFGAKSCLLTGDAMKETIERIRTARSDLSADIIVASHHGADDCNTDELIRNSNARYVVFSSGKWKNYGHPRLEAVLRYRNVLGDRLAKTTWHTVCAGAVDRIDDAQEGLFAVTKDKYGLIATDQGIYCTLIQGNITFKWRLDSLEVAVPKCKQGESLGANKKEHILETLASTDNEREDFALQNCVSVLLNDLKIGDSDDLLMKVICIALRSCVNVRHIDLSNNQLKGSLERLVKLLRKNQYILTFRIQNNLLDDQDKALLLAAWHNRGMSL